MKYAIDTEFIDTPEHTELLSLAVVREDGEYRYFEFAFQEEAVTPWLEQHVMPHLAPSTSQISFAMAADALRSWINKHEDPHPEFWAYYGAYDWYWMQRVMGGMMNKPDHWPMLFIEFANQGSVPQYFKPEHHALADARSLMQELRGRNISMQRAPLESPYSEGGARG